MGLLSSIFSRSKPASDAASTEADTGDSVARARRRARQRLLGAVVLVGIGIIGFPLLFETQPRPIPVDVPIEIPAREGAAPLTLPSAQEAQPKAAADSSNQSAAQSKTPEPMITETAAEAAMPAAAEKAAAQAEKPKPEQHEKAAEAKPAVKPEVIKAESKPSHSPAPTPAPTPAPADRAEAARARALLEGKVSPKESASATRYIVQIGAFADPALARATRLKVERLGLTTYTHVAKTANGDRTRVRVGPVASREEAEKIAAKIKAAGMPTAILTL